MNSDLSVIQQEELPPHIDAVEEEDFDMNVFEDHIKTQQIERDNLESSFVEKDKQKPQLQSSEVLEATLTSPSRFDPPAQTHGSESRDGKISV